MNINNLSNDEKKMLISLLQKSMEEPIETVEKPKKGRGRPRKNKTDEPSQQTTVKKTSGPTKIGKKQNTKNQSGGACRVESLDISGNRKNRFLEMAAFNQEKADTKIDKLLRKGREPIVRATRKQALVNGVECSKCNNLFNDVPAAYCYKDDEGIRFVCQECQ